MKNPLISYLRRLGSLISILALVVAVRAQSMTIPFIAAEKQFASHALAEGIKAAFLEHLDSAGIVVNAGQFVNGRKFYAQVSPETTEALFWQPAYARTNQAGTFGFTSGPYHYYADRRTFPVLSGYYFSIWKTDLEGRLKVFFDGGVNHSTAVPVKLADITPVLADTVQHGQLNWVNKGKGKPKTFRLFQNALVRKPLSAYQKYLNDAVLVLRPDQPFHTSAVGYLAYCARGRQPVFDYRHYQEGFDPQRQLYYQFGHLTGTAGKICGYFVRIWQLQKNRWKIVADVQQYEP
ncbi:hypothetical protein EOD41_03300 [Mucilaginibacter limnophilus]|uniref:Uncharacterized protein n=1 Tax=Mucilaginibacter limnophilus TaxID=1932778 RepID=A0A3S3TK92_9SPHI|nr:hypothetical protein [Mucilaginibacter limnophilus]RVU02974.1 hypothetical protein EOD41_03300 [Mucilaginibacter limnophilus]